MNEATWDQLVEKESMTGGVRLLALDRGAKALSEDQIRPALASYSRPIGGLEAISSERVEAGSWVGVLWKEADKGSGHTSIDDLPEVALWKMETENVRFTKADFHFLIGKANTSAPAARSAIRLLAGVAGENQIPVDSLTPFLKDFLKDPDPNTRLAAAEAIWQLVDRGALENVRSALATEENSVVKATLSYVVGVLS